MRRFLAMLCTVVATVGVVQAHPDPQLEVVVKGLQRPWGIAFLPDGSFLVSERAGHLLHFRSHAEANDYARHPISGVPAVRDEGQGGLLDVLVDPAFSDNGRVYLSYSVVHEERFTTRVMRARLDGDSLVDASVLFTASPGHPASVHYGGRLLMLPSRELLLGLGDGFDEREAAQDANSHLGKIVRISADGNADQAGATRVYSSGHRNVQGLVYLPESNAILAHEHGPQGGDELNVIVAGGNYGWPLLTRGVDYTGAQVSPFARWPGESQYRDAILDWTPSIAPSGMIVYQGSMFPDWQHDLLITSLAARDLRRVTLKDGQVQAQEILLEDEDKRWRDVELAPDGSVWLLQDGGDAELMRLFRKGAGTVPASGAS